jgi:hypothetical protein
MYTISGRYVASCSCREVCACAHDGPPGHPRGSTECFGGAVFHIERGNLEGVDLSGVDFAIFNYFPSNFSAGNWKIGVVVDEAASEEQVRALETILSGAAGGPFADMAPLMGEFLGIERGRVRYADGDSPSASVEGELDIRFSPYRAPDGTPTTIRNAAFGFAPEYTIGKASGWGNGFGGTFAYDAIYGEAAEFTYSSEAHDLRPRA